MRLDRSSRWRPATNSTILQDGRVQHLSKTPYNEFEVEIFSAVFRDKKKFLLKELDRILLLAYEFVVLGHSY